MSESQLVVNRWRRYGKDRLYVLRGDESKVGWWDLTVDQSDEDGAAHPESPDTLLVLLKAVHDWQTNQPKPALTPAVVAAPGVTGDVDVPVHPASTCAQGDPDSLISPASVEPLTRPWIDLTTNTAGAEAREQAAAAKDAAPVKTFLARALGVHTNERAWRIGADGEQKVAEQLAKATKKDPRWRFLHAIPVGERGSDIDHLIIGPGGVFTVNTKHHPKANIWVGGDTFMVNGNKQPYIRNSRHEAARAARLLSAVCGFPVHVEALIVTVNATDIVIKKNPAGVHVVPRMRIVKWLLRHGDIHNASTIDTIHDAARRSTTWKP